MNKRGDKTYRAKHHCEMLAIGTQKDKAWLKTDKHVSRKMMTKNMIRRWRRKLKMSLRAEQNDV